LGGDRRFNLGLDLLDTKTRSWLHRRKIDRRLSQSRNGFLHHDEAPELAGEEAVHEAAAATIVHGFAAHRVQTLERILAQVRHHGCVGDYLLTEPPIRLLVELELEVPDAHRAEMGTPKVDDFISSGWALASQQRRLVVAVEIVLVGALADLHTLEEFLLDVWSAGGRRKRRQPIKSGEDAVLNRAWLDLARPADDGRHAEATFVDGSLGGLERRHAAVGPGEHLSSVVGREDDNRVVGLAHVLNMLQQGAN